MSGIIAAKGMSRPTKYQRWWMVELAKCDGVLVWLLDDSDGGQTRNWFFGHGSLGATPAINKYSVKVVAQKGWLSMDKWGDYSLTPAGRKALGE